MSKTHTSKTSHLVEVSRSAEPVEEEPDERQIVDWLCGALDQLESSPAEVSVRIVEEEEMASLNGQYRNNLNPTNVLSFPSGIETDENVFPNDHGFLGDIVVCNQVVLDESREFGQSVSDRYAHMLVHGLLHLLGHDHIEEEERREMENLEKKLLANFGISDPYVVVESEVVDRT